MKLRKKNKLIALLISLTLLFSISTTLYYKEITNRTGKLENEACTNAYKDVQFGIRLCLPNNYSFVKHLVNGVEKVSPDYIDENGSKCLMRNTKSPIQNAYLETETLCYALANGGSPQVKRKQETPPSGLPYELVGSGEINGYPYTLYSHSLYYAAIEVINIKLSGKNINFYYYVGHAKSTPSQEQLTKFWQIINSVSEVG